MTALSPFHPAFPVNDLTAAVEMKAFADIGDLFAK